MANRTSNPIPEEKMKMIIQEGDAQELVKQADTWGTRFGMKRGSESAVSTNQIRAIFGTVRQIEMNWPVKHDERADQKLAKAQRDLRLLQPKIVYRAAREKKSQEFQQFAAMMVDAIDLLLADDKKVESRFEHFVNFFEALMAYHKAAGEGVYIGKEG